jgi:hypothetical protein
MKYKIILMLFLFLCFATPATAATQFYCGFGATSKLAIVNHSTTPQEIQISFISNGEKYTGRIVVNKHEVYVARVEDLALEIGHSPDICAGAFGLIVFCPCTCYSKFITTNGIAGFSW